MFGGVGTILGAFGVSLGIDTNSYTRGILQADALNQVFGQGVTTFLANPLLGALNAFQAVAGAAVRHSQRILAAAEDTERLSQRTGVSVELLQALTGRFEQAGFGAQVAAQGVRTLAQRLGEAQQGIGESGRVLDALGLDPASFRDTDAAIVAIVQALSEVENVSVRAALAAKLFGEEAGAKFVNAVGGGADALAALVAEQRALGQVLDGGTITSLAAANTQLGKLQQALGGVRDVALANFLAGFIDETQVAGSNIEDLSSKLINGVAPAAREAGEALGQIVGNLDDINDRLDSLLNGPVASILSFEVIRTGRVNGTPVPGLFGIQQSISGGLTTFIDGLYEEATRGPQQ